MAGFLWRRTLWPRVGAAARDLAANGEIRPVWAGWRVEADGVRVTWRGGLWGPGTAIRTQRGRRWIAGLLDAEGVRAAARSVG